MAKDKEKDKSKDKKGPIDLSNISKGVQDSINHLYQQTFYTGIDNRKALMTLRKDMNDTIGSIIDKNMSTNGTHLSSLYSRLQTSKEFKNDDLVKSIDDIFGSKEMIDGIMATYVENKYIKELDNEIDMVCRYMPKLEDAIDAKVEMILSSDSFTKSFLDIRNASHADEDMANFNRKIEAMKVKHKLPEIVENAIYNVCKYGEEFIHTPSYNTEFARMFKDEEKKLSESYSIIAEKEGVSSTLAIDDTLAQSISSIFGESFNLNIELNNTPYIRSFVENAAIINEAKNKYDGKKPLISADDLELPEGYGKDDLKASDGLVDSKEKIDVPGCLVRRLPRANIIPQYIDDICLGYYYIETDGMTDGFEFIENQSDPMKSLKKKETMSNDMNKDALLKNISKKLSGVITKKFINANQDISKDIYVILKHNYDFKNANSKIKVTFLPPSEVHHLYYRLDPLTHRGISDLYRALIPAKLYACLYISNSIGILTRSQDKRVYYVKQTVDTNIAQTIQDTMLQIKKSNFGMREINNVNYVINGLTGRYNDYIIPESQSGDRPIQFEIMPGQDIDTKPEFMENLEALALNSTGTPLELIEARKSIEFSRQITQSNGKFARHVMKRQTLSESQLSIMLTCIYNLDNDENVVLEAILPPPTFLTIVNTLDMLRNVQDFIETYIMIDVLEAERDQPWVQVYKRKLLRYHLGSYINFGVTDQLKDAAKVEAKLLSSGDETS